MRITLLLFSLVLVLFGSRFAEAQTLFTDRTSFQGAAGGVGDIFDDCNSGGTDRGTHDYSGDGLFAFPNGNPTTDIDGTGYVRAGIEAGSGTVTITFDLPVVAIGFDVNPWCNGGACGGTNSIGSTINFTTTGTLAPSGSYTLPLVYGPEFRGLVFGAGSSITSISFTTLSPTGWHGMDNMEFFTDPNFVGEICANGIDDNANGLVDCDDPDCSNEPTCLLPGDSCLAPLVAVEGSQPFDTSLMTTSPEPSDPSQCLDLGDFDSDIWFEFTVPSDGILDASICGTASFGSDFGVYLGDCGSLVQIGCAGDTPGCDGFTGEVVGVNALAGQQYLIRVGGWFPGDAGPGSLQVTFTPTGPTFVRGDTNLDGTLDIADAVASLAFLFDGGAASCLDAVDTNDDGMVDIADAVYTLGFLFTMGPQPPAPFPAPGIDPTPDPIGC